MQWAHVVLCRWTRYARLLSRHKGTKGDEYSIFSEACTYYAGTQSEKMTLAIRSRLRYDSLSDVGEIRVYQRADFQSGSRVLKKVF